MTLALPTESALRDARLSLHHALQVVAAAGQSLAPRAPDDAQQALEVIGPRRWLGVPVGDGRWRAALDPVSAELALVDGANAPLETLAFEGRTLGEGLAFLRGALRHAGGPDAELALPRHPEDFPHHPLAEGARFPAGGHEGRAALALLFWESQTVLAAPVGPGGPIRLWPHHFDLGVQAPVGGLTLGLGFSPGDGADGAPYWYATFWPRPRGDLPPLAGGGSWRTGGWEGAELPLARVAVDDGARRRQVEAFFSSALDAARQLAAAAARA